MNPPPLYIFGAILVLAGVLFVPCISVASEDDNAKFIPESPEALLVDRIVEDCSRKASLSCVSKNAYRYLDTAFNTSADWDVTEGLKFAKNDREIPQAQEEAESSRNARGLDDITDALYEKGVRYLQGHDLTLSLPETVFGGAVFKVSTPRSDSKTLFQVELVVPEEKEDEEENMTAVDARAQQSGTRLFKKLFGKHLKKRLLLGFFALLLIIKLIKIKLFFLLPLILGVGTVKKLAIKFLFFIFPALAALFKSCHHHHHHIPVKQYHLHTVKHSHPHYYEDHGHHGGPPDWLRRNEYVGDTTTSWEPQNSAAAASSYYDDRVSRQSPPVTEPTGTGGYQVRTQVKQNPAHLAYRNQLQQQTAAMQQRYQQQGSSPLNSLSSSAAAAQFVPHPQLPHKVGQLSQPSPLHQEQIGVSGPSTSALAGTTGSGAIPATSDTYDAFYSPILYNLDQVFLQLGFNDEPCRERLVCSMYKTPTRFSPHSNLVSAELSRDPSELQRPTTANAAVVRFFRYVQAAKDGQEHKECLRLYPGCPVNTEP